MNVTFGSYSGTATSELDPRPFCPIAKTIAEYTSEMNTRPEKNMRSMLKALELSRIKRLCLSLQPVTSSMDLQVQASQLHMSCGLEPIVMCLDFESMGIVHLCMSPKRTEKL